MQQGCHVRCVSSMLPGRGLTMKQNYERGPYSPGSYDRYLCLRPPLLLWVALLYLSRAVSLPLVLGLSSLAGSSADTTGLVHGMFGPSTLLPSCLAFMVLWTLALRSPSAGPLARRIFARGRVLLIAAAVLDAVLGVTLAGVSRDSIESADEHAGVVLLGALFDLYLIIYLLFSKRVRDVFADFPAADLPASK